MNNQPFFSIIIPVYNVEKYVAAAIESVLKQNFDDYEIILIDDGSVDSSGDICEDFSLKYKNIICIHKENGGVSSARNTGIEISSGRYIIFVDPDDILLANTMLTDIYTKAAESKADLIAFPYKRFYEDSELAKVCFNNLNEKNLINKTVCTAYFLDKVLRNKEVYGWFPWPYAYKKTLWDSERFNENLSIFEDSNIIYKILLSAETISILPAPYYGYRCGRKGALTNFNPLRIRQAMEATAQTITDIISNDTIDSKLKELLCSNMSHSYYICLIHLYSGVMDRTEFISILKEFKWLTIYTRYGKDVAVKIILKIFGIRITGRLLALRRKIREIPLHKRSGKKE